MTYDGFDTQSAYIEKLEKENQELRERAEAAETALKELEVWCEKCMAMFPNRKA